MDLSELVAFLAPLLPYLLKGGIEAGKAAAGELGKKITSEAWDGLKKLAEKIRAKAKQKPGAAEVIAKAEAKPDDPRARGAVEMYLEELLQENPDLLTEANQVVGSVFGGVIAQDNSLAVGQGGLGVDGDMTDSIATIGNNNQSLQVHAPVGGDILGPGAQKVEQHFYGDKNTDPAVLEREYLSLLLKQAGQLSLEGIDPQAASEAEKRLSLGAVYTALLTLSPEAHDRLERGEMSAEKIRYRSALEELKDHRHLVLLGDPGSGKTTFVNFLCLCLAGERLGNAQLNLKTLTAPLPDDDGDDEDHPQPWRHGALLPLRVILRDFAARGGLPAAGQAATAAHLWKFLKAEMDELGLKDYVPHLQHTLQQNGGLILFDGLDEVPEAESRREQIIQIVHQVKEAYPACWVMVTSRLYAYRRQDWALEGFDATVLAPFSRGQIIRFVDRWYAHIAQLRSMNPQDAQGRAQLLKRAIFASDRLQALAERPLLLTLMASLHAWRGGSLPEKREQLYSDTVDLLLDWWEKRRVVRKADGTVLWMSPSLAEYLNVGKDRLRALLNELAYEAHARQPDLQGTADIPENELVRGLLALTAKEDVRPRRLVEYLRDRAGLLIPRGVGVYTFPHRTFQEYLAACYLTDDDYPDKVAKLAKAEPDRWREVALLAGAKAARGAASTIWNLTEALCCEDVPEKGDLPADGVWGAYLAGQALAESADLRQVSKNNQPKLERVQKWLVAILERSPLPAIERARAGDTLAALGDPRFKEYRFHSPLPSGEGAGVRVILPATPTLGFLRIPKGKFLMGSREHDPDAYDDEKHQHELDLPYDYWIGKYPVTVAQWRAFVEASGYRHFDQRALRDLDNRPVRYVTWHDALAYCDWLDGVLKEQASKIQPLDEAASAFWQALALGKYRVTLPSEAEWEKAARGPLTPSPRPEGHPPSPLPRGEGKGGRGVGARVYPWGDTFDPNKANTHEAGIGTTTTVGAFPLGLSPYGCADMSGNVWEWTRTIWDDKFGYPYKLNDGREDLKRKDRDRVVRGGSFDDSRRNARCASRLRHDPNRLYWDRGFRVVVSPIYI